jgi:hypothetical protein
VAHVDESLKVSDYFGDTAKYGRIILKLILKYKFRAVSAAYVLLLKGTELAICQ